MGKKGKSKNTSVISAPEAAPKVEAPETKEASSAVKVEPKVEKKIEEKVEEKKVEEKVEPLVASADVANNDSGTLKSKKNRNKKNKSEKLAQL